MAVPELTRADLPKKVSSQVRTWVDRTVNGLIAEGRERGQLILGFRRQRMMRLKPNLPEAYQQYLGKGVRVPISFRLVETVVGAVAGGDEGPQFFASSPDLDLRQRTATWCRLMFEAQHRISEAALYYKYWDGLIADGMIALKTLRRPWSDFPARLEEETDEQYNDRVEAFFRQMPRAPFKTRIVDPATFHPPRSEWGRGYALESGLRPTEEVFRQLGLRPTRTGNIVVVKNVDEPTPLDMPGLRMGPRVQVDELWTDEALFVRVHGQIFEYPNELGRLPYLWTSGAAIAFSDPTLQALSVLYPLQYLEPWVNQFLSTLVGNASQASVPTAKVTHAATGTPGAAGETQISDIPFGKMVDLPPGSDFGFESMPIDGNSVALFNSMVQLAERFTLSPIPQFAGTRTPGVVLSAVAERIMSVLRPRIDQAQRTWAEQMKFYLDLVQRVVKAPVAVSGLILEERSGRSRLAETVITPRDVPKISDVMVQIGFQTLQDRIAWDTHNVLMMQSGLWSRERAMRESRVKDTVEEDRQIRLDRLMRTPAIDAYLTQQALAGQPPLEALQELLAAAQQETAGAARNGASANGAGEEAARAEGGRLPGEPRAPGGTRPPTSAGFLQ